MKQYLDLLKIIKTKGTPKDPSRPGMPGSLSYFGYQTRYNLSEGFPMITTKKVSFKNIVVEMLWFLRGDTNIKFLLDHNVNIWNEDAFNYYEKLCKEQGLLDRLNFDQFVKAIKDPSGLYLQLPNNYNLGDCGFQYGKVWRKWEKYTPGEEENFDHFSHIDQILKVLKNLKTNPESRRHLVTAIDPAHDEDLALYWCHSMFQFNCRRMTFQERVDYFVHQMGGARVAVYKDMEPEGYLDGHKVPRYFLDCQMYQRSADMFLGVPYNISSYALITHVFATILNMVPGDFIHTFGDAHIYDNHVEQTDLQLTREPKTLPKLVISKEADNVLKQLGTTIETYSSTQFNTVIKSFLSSDFKLEGYEHHPEIKGDLSTGLQK